MGVVALLGWYVTSYNTQSMSAQYQIQSRTARPFIYYLENCPKKITNDKLNSWTRENKFLSKSVKQVSSLSVLVGTLYQSCIE